MSLDVPASLPACRAVAIFYSAAVLLSAALVFSAQPLIGKLVLPLFGGSPAVWNTCMVFFQAALLAGYSYAHAISRRFAPRTQMVLHLIVLTLPLLVLPLGVPADWSPDTTTRPVWSLLVLLCLVAGAPFFAVTTNAPLLQHWFTHTRHPAARDPYFLYATSNAGSMSVLLAYPLLIEPQLGLSDQTWWWSVGYGLFVVLVAGCAAVTWRTAGSIEAAIDSSTATDQSRHFPKPAMSPIDWKTRGWWLLLSFVPSSWLLSVTARLTTDFAPIPLLWVIPLALYLLTFILVFAQRQLVPHEWIVRIYPFAIVLLIGSLISEGWRQLVLINLAAFGIGTMLCHGELARRRPSSEHLTEFYLWMSVGGVLGGIFNGIVAPLMFPVLLEFPLIVLLASLCYRRQSSSERSAVDLILAIGATAGVALMAQRLGSGLPPAFVAAVSVAVVASLISVMLRRDRVLAGACAVVLIWDQYQSPPTVKVLHRARSFFGIHRVDEDIELRDELTGAPQPRFRRLTHGTTQHGFQSLDLGRTCEPMAYYHRSGPLGDVMSAFVPGERGQHIGVVGLGTGAMACYANPLRTFTFYEIDPIVARIAQTPEFFTYLSACGRDRYRVVLGDGRLMLAHAADGQFDLIVLDAFSSDAIPAHLLTREALQLYLQKLRPDGVLVFHVSNRFLNLPAVLGDLAHVLNLHALVCADQPPTEAELARWLESGKADSTYVVLAPQESALTALKSNVRWRALGPRSVPAPWTDDYSNLFSILKPPSVSAVDRAINPSPATQ